jgi:hypothetical protein
MKAPQTSLAVSSCHTPKLAQFTGLSVGKVAAGVGISAGGRAAGGTGFGGGAGGCTAQADNNKANSHGLARNGITGEDGSDRKHASSITMGRRV